MPAESGIGVTAVHGEALAIWDSSCDVGQEIRRIQRFTEAMHSSRTVEDVAKHLYQPL